MRAFSEANQRLYSLNPTSLLWSHLSHRDDKDESESPPKRLKTEVQPADRVADFNGIVRAMTDNPDAPMSAAASAIMAEVTSSVVARAGTGYESDGSNELVQGAGTPERLRQPAHTLAHAVPNERPYHQPPPRYQPEQRQNPHLAAVVNRPPPMPPPMPPQPPVPMERPPPRPFSYTLPPAPPRAHMPPPQFMPPPQPFAPPAAMPMASPMMPPNGGMHAFPGGMPMQGGMPGMPMMPMMFMQAPILPPQPSSANYPQMVDLPPGTPPRAHSFAPLPMPPAEPPEMLSAAQLQAQILMQEQAQLAAHKARMPIPVFNPPPPLPPLPPRPPPPPPVPVILPPAPHKPVILPPAPQYAQPPPGGAQFARDLNAPRPPPPQPAPYSQLGGFAPHM